MTERFTLQEAIVEHQNRFDAAVRGLDPQVLETEPVVGDWPVKAVACHLADWAEEILAAAQATVDGVPVEGHPIPDGDAFNHAHVSQGAGASWEETSARLHRVVERAAGFVGDLDGEQLDLPAVLPWGGEGTLARLLRGIPGHHEEHLEELESWRRERAG